MLPTAQIVHNCTLKYPGAEIIRLVDIRKCLLTGASPYLAWKLKSPQTLLYLRGDENADEKKKERKTVVDEWGRRRGTEGERERKGRTGEGN